MVVVRPPQERRTDISVTDHVEIDLGLVDTFGPALLRYVPDPVELTYGSALRVASVPPGDVCRGGTV